MAQLSGPYQQVRSIAIIGIVLSLGILAVLTIIWGVFMAKPLPIRVERRDVVATVVGQGVLAAPAGGGLTTRVNLGRVEAAAVRPGDEAALTFDKMQRTTLRGRVAQITQTQTAPWPVYQALVQVQTPAGASVLGTTAGGGIGPGLSTSVVITVGRAAGVLAVPNDALVRKARGESSVAVLRQGTWRMVPVQVGLLGDNYTEIRRGLREGEIVRLTPGVPGAR